MFHFIITVGKAITRKTESLTWSPKQSRVFLHQIIGVAIFKLSFENLCSSLHHETFPQLKAYILLWIQT